MLHTTAEYRSRERDMEGDGESGLSACVCSKPTQQTTLRQIVGIKRSSLLSSSLRQTDRPSVRQIPFLPYLPQSGPSLSAPVCQPGFTFRCLATKKASFHVYVLRSFSAHKASPAALIVARVVSTFTFTLLLFLASRHHH